MFTKILCDLESSVQKTILYGLRSLPFALGVSKFIGVLRGSKSCYIVDNNLHTLEVYGIMSCFSKEYLKDIIGMLVKEGLVDVESAAEFREMPVVKISQRGLDYLEDKITIKLPFMKEKVDLESLELTVDDQRLFDEMRVLRGKLARERNIPPYTVCSDSTLRNLAIKKPDDIDSLLSIKGIGEKFLTSYGKEFLILINED